MVVARDASIEVTETIRARFTGAWNGLYRTIPVVYGTPQGFGYRLFLCPLGVTDGAARPLRYQASSERHYRKFKIGSRTRRTRPGRSSSATAWRMHSASLPITTSSTGT